MGCLLDRVDWGLDIQGVINTLGSRQDGRHFADDIFTCIFSNENCCVLVKFSLKYVRKGPIDNNPALVQIMAWRLSGGKPLSEPMMISLPTYICVTRPQWVNSLWPSYVIWQIWAIFFFPGNGLLPDVTKPLSESLLIYHQYNPIVIFMASKGAWIIF